MPNNRDRLFVLAKVLIASAWADGEISLDEKNCLKDIIFRLAGTGGQLSGREWSLLDMYMDSPVLAEERARLVADLQAAIQTSAERQYVLDALQMMADADGVSGPDEQRVITEIGAAVDGAAAGFMDGLNRLLGGAMRRRSAAVSEAPNREMFFDDYLQNKVYYETSRRLREEGRSLDLSDAEMRRLGLAGGMMARIAQVDREISADEYAAIVRTMMATWSLDRETAEFVADVATSSLDYTYDYYRMTREFAAETSNEERRNFLTALFILAGVDGGASFDETEEIRLVAQGLNLSHQDFIDAKLKARALTN